MIGKLQKNIFKNLSTMNHSNISQKTKELFRESSSSNFIFPARCFRRAS